MTKTEQIENSFPVFKFFDGRPVLTESDFEARKKEIRETYEREIYGVYKTGEKVSWEICEADDEDDDKNPMPFPVFKSNDENLNKVKINITVSDDGREGTFSCKVYFPKKEDFSESSGSDFYYNDGSPVIIAMGDFFQKEFVLSKNIAVITFSPYDIASDNSERKGVFYDVHPYGKSSDEQSGALVAWGWGFSKILDALFSGAGKELGINPKNNLVTGVSRFGKATFVAGAMDKRIKISVPACSGAGGTALFRYKSEGDKYDYSSLGEVTGSGFGPDPNATPVKLGEYVLSKNEPLGSLQSKDERHWFNDKFLSYKSEDELPIEQHLMSTMYVNENKFLFITASYVFEDWTNPPAMWANFILSRKVFERFNEANHIYFHIHKQGHAVIDEDVQLLVEYMERVFYGKTSATDFSAMPKCIYGNL